MEPTILRVGRGDYDKDNRKNDIQINHPSVSRAHLEVFVDPYNNVFITDLQTRNGTFVNGNPVVGTILLNDGDILKLGSAKPIQWKKWIKGDYSYAEDTTNPPKPKSIISDHQERLMMTTAGQQKKSKKKKLFLLLLFTVIIFVGLIIWYFNNTTLAVNDKKETTFIYTRFDLETKDYISLQQLLPLKVKVSSLSSGDIIKTADDKNVEVIIDNNLLTGLSILADAGTISSMDTVLQNKKNVKRDSLFKKNKIITDSDNDGVADAIDQCVNVKGPASNNGCPINYYLHRENNDGTYEVRVLNIGESLNQFRDRIIKIPNLSCQHPSTSSEIILLNEVLLNNDNKRFGTLPPGVWIRFKCY